MKKTSQVVLKYDTPSRREKYFKSSLDVRYPLLNVELGYCPSCNRTHYLDTLYNGKTEQILVECFFTKDKFIIQHSLGRLNEPIYNMNKIEYIAKTCHEANKVWCEANGYHTQKHWDEAEQWQRDSAISGVHFKLNNPNAGHDAQHNSWMKEKVNAGWVYGEIKDAEKKTHPCIVPFEQLPEFQQKKDALFCAIIDSLK